VEQILEAIGIEREAATQNESVVEDEASFDVPSDDDSDDAT
jgi:hypothetical protein